MDLFSPILEEKDNKRTTFTAPNLVCFFEMSVDSICLTKVYCLYFVFVDLGKVLNRFPSDVVW